MSFSLGGDAKVLGRPRVSGRSELTIKLEYDNSDRSMATGFIQRRRSRGIDFGETAEHRSPKTRGLQLGVFSPSNHAFRTGTKASPVHCSGIPLDLVTRLWVLTYRDLYTGTKPAHGGPGQTCRDRPVPTGPAMSSPPTSHKKKKIRSIQFDQSGHRVLHAQPWITLDEPQPPIEPAPGTEPCSGLATSTHVVIILRFCEHGCGC